MSCRQPKGSVPPVLSEKPRFWHFLNVFQASVRPAASAPLWRSCRSSVVLREGCTVPEPKVSR